MRKPKKAARARVKASVRDIEVEQLQAQLAALQARVEQLEALLEGRPPDRIGQGLARLRARARGMEMEADS